MSSGPSCGKRGRRRPRGSGGARWGGLSIERTSRFVVAWAAGPDPEELAATIILATRARTVGRAGLPWVGDGRAAYEETIQAAYRDAVPSGIRENWRVLRPATGVRLTQAIKRH